MLFAGAHASAQDPDPTRLLPTPGEQPAPMQGEWMACPEGSQFSQVPHEPADAWSAHTSDLHLGPYTVYENFSGLAAPVTAVHFWGLTLFFDGGWSVCDTEDPMEFEICFYQDNAGEPGSPVSCETVTVPRQSTGLSFIGFPLYYFRAELSGAVNLAGGWISIRGTSLGSPDCAFSWMSSGTGDGKSFQLAGGALAPLSYDKSICLESGEVKVPLANWAVYLGMALALGFLLLLFRRMF